MSPSIGWIFNIAGPSTSRMEFRRLPSSRGYSESLWIFRTSCSIKYGLATLLEDAATSLKNYTLMRNLRIFSSRRLLLPSSFHSNQTAITHRVPMLLLLERMIEKKTLQLRDYVAAWPVEPVLANANSPNGGQSRKLAKDIHFFPFVPVSGMGVTTL